MAPAAGPISPSDASPAISPSSCAAGDLSPTAFSVAGNLTASQKDKVIEWYRGEFAAANAIIDALCHHLFQLSGAGEGGVPVVYEAAFAAIHRRRLNWIPVLQRQKYYTIADVALELRNAAAALTVADGDVAEEKIAEEKIEVKMEDENEISDDVTVNSGKCNGESNSDANNGSSASCNVSEGDESPDSEITDTGSHEVQASLDDHMEICENHEEECGDRREQIKMTKGFVAKEPVRGHMVNVVKGLKIFENIFTDSELSKLNDFVYELRAAGQNGQLLGETYISFNKNMKANKREQIQLGVPIFGQIRDDAMGQEQKPNIEDIPALLQSVIDHLVQWHILPENRRPNGCIINYFDEGEYAQPYLKPPHLDQPVCTLILSESTLAFGRTLVNDGEGHYKGNLMLSIKEGSVLVMRNHSADMARHAMCASPTRRVSITFSRVRPGYIPNHHHHHHAPSPYTTPSSAHQAMTLWHQQGIPTSPTLPNGGAPIELVPKWGVIQTPVVMLAPAVRPMAMSPQAMPNGGTGVFLPWAQQVAPRKPTRHLPPRAQRGRFRSVQITHNISDTMSDPGVEGRTI